MHRRCTRTNAQKIHTLVLFLPFPRVPTARHTGSSGRFPLCLLCGHLEEGRPSAWLVSASLTRPPGGRQGRSGHCGPEAIWVQGCRWGCWVQVWWPGHRPGEPGGAGVRGYRPGCCGSWENGSPGEASRGLLESARGGVQAGGRGGVGSPPGHQVTMVLAELSTKPHVVVFLIPAPWLCGVVGMPSFCR